MSPTSIACPGCDSLYRIDPDANVGVAECPRCGAVLWRVGRHSQGMTLALVIASLSLFLAAQLFPLLLLRLHGTTQETTVLASIGLLARTGWPWLAAVLIVTAELAPGAYLCGLAYVLVRVKQGRANRRTGRLFRIVQEVQGWAMVDVFILGVLVSYVKLAKLAVVVPGGALYALAGSALLLAWAVDSMDCQSLWKAMGEAP